MVIGSHQVHEVVVDVGVIKVQQRLTTIAGVEGHSVAVTTLTDIREEIDKVVIISYCIISLINSVHVTAGHVTHVRIFHHRRLQ
jgi:hypothetical protein